MYNKQTGHQYDSAFLSACAIRMANQSEYTKLLGNEEKIYFDTLKYPKRIMEYLIGRYVGKVSYGTLIGESDIKSIEITQDLHGGPIVLYKNVYSSSISISHCDNLAVALAYNSKTPMGIDIEFMSERKSDILKNILTEQEEKKAEKQQESIEKRIWRYIAWTTKEALSKVIRTGFTLPLSFYEIKSIFKVRDKFITEFTYFTQYRAYTVIKNNYIISFICSKKLELFFKI
ncbi:MAG: 4'-phosphopantetheinyl transferase superfamily protein [Clostridioides difficile]|nr:4'-phosphopantetheinyl transferase superfamily protein [Clostridioides difficile]